MLLACLAGAVTAHAQVIRLHELERYNRGDSLQAIRNGDIVEINATIRLELNKVAIAEEARRFAGVPAVDLVKLEDLRDLLRDQVEILRLFNAQPDGEDVEGLYDLAELMNDYLDKIANAPLLRQYYNDAGTRYDQAYPRSRDRAARIQRGEIPMREAFIFMEFSKLANHLAKQAAGELPDGEVRFLLAGFLRTSQGASRPVKLSEEFDTYEGQFYSVPRWEIALSEEGKQTLNQITQLSDSLRIAAMDKSFSVKNWLKTGIQSDDCLKSLPSLWNDVIQGVEEAVPTKAAEVEAVLLRPLNLVGDLLKSLNQIQSDGGAPVALLETFNRNLGTTIDSLGVLLQLLDEDLLQSLDLGPATEPIVQRAISSLVACRDNLAQDLSNLRKIRHTFTHMIGGARMAAQSAEIIGNEVRRLPIDLVPAESFIDLRYAGPRANGDQVVIKAILEREDGGKKQQKPMDQRLFTLQQIGLYSIVKPMLVLADPLIDNAGVQLRSRFQFAPSYSLLFKWGSRKSKAFNQVWSPGLGFNFSATDFNLDGVPEFGAAFEFTFLRDYLAGGLGYNFGADASYFFMGFRLPIAAVPLPVFNNVDVQN